MTLLAALVSLTLSATAGVEPSTEALLNDLVLRASAADHRLDVVAWEGPAPRTACFADPACLSRLADATETRLVLFGEVGVRDGLTLFSLNIYDVRTGLFAGRETAQTDTSQALSEQIPKMVVAVVDRAFAPLGGVPRLGMTVVGLLPPGRAAERADPIQVPWLLFGSGVVASTGVLFLAGAAVLYGMAIERDLRAAAAVYQIDAFLFVRDRNTFALSAVMTAMISMGFFLFAAMGTTYWVLQE